MHNDQLWHNLQARLQHLAGGHGLAVAFSGGLDSRFLLHAAQAAGCDILALHIQGVHIPQAESSFAQHWAYTRGIRCLCIAVDILSLKGIVNNSRQRCYHCKQEIMAQCRHMADARILCDGTNADDLIAHRPGIRALQEAKVCSPLADMGITKAMLRQIAQDTGMDMPEQSPRPCLLTRLAYGMTPTPNLLCCIEKAEDALKTYGLVDFRLRLCPQPLLHTLPLQKTQRREALALLQQHGFTDVQLLEETHIGGYFDRDIP